MKTVTTELANLINGKVFAVFDLYTITLFDGTALYLTTCDVDIAWGGVTFPAKTARIDQSNTKSQAHWKIGLDVDQWQVAVQPRSRDEITGAAFPDTIGSIPWLAAAAAGALDAARVLIQRAYFPLPLPVPAWPQPPGGLVPTGVITIFLGQIAECDVTTSEALLTINDMRQLLTVNMPRNLYQPSCRHRLFDAQCTLNANNYAATGVVGANSSRFTIMASLPAPQGSGTWQFGRIRMTSGLNAGYSRTIAKWDGAQTFTLMAPFFYAIALGDAFTMWSGCDKSYTTCQAFGNQLNYGGDPFVPTPETTTSG